MSVETYRQEIVGYWTCGTTAVQVVAREGTGGEFYSCPDSDNMAVPRIKIGMDQPWGQIGETLMHEALEFASVQLGLRYEPCFKTCDPEYAFFMSHGQFSEMICRASELVIHMLPILSSVHSRWKKPKKGLRCPRKARKG